MTDEQASVERVLAAHRAAGVFFTAGGVRSFVRAQGEGDPVLLIHGLPASSFLYRKVIPELARRGFRALAFDWPGLGLADRPMDFDYTIAGLGGFTASAVDALGLHRFHLVVHDAGGPVGFELALRTRDRVRSLTILNTMIDLPGMPFPGEALSRVTHRIGGLGASPRLWRQMLYRVGVENRSMLPMPEVLAYRDLALGDNGGATYLEIMRRIRVAHEPGRWTDAVDARSVPYPIRIVWGGLDPMLTLRRYGWRMLAASHLPWITVLPARHFLQEDQAPQVAEQIARNARRRESVTDGASAGPP